MRIINLVENELGESGLKSRRAGKVISEIAQTGPFWQQRKMIKSWASYV